MRYLVITMNAAVDITYLLDTFRWGSLSRASRVFAMPGRKGNNVGRVPAAFGHSVTPSGIVGGHTGQLIEDSLRSRGIGTEFVKVEGESRRCLTFIAEGSGVVSEVIEPGIEVSRDEGAQLLRRAGEIAQDVDVAVISGSLPRGLPADYYASLIDELHGAGIPVAFDSSGEPLRHGLQAGPDLIKPNRNELSDLLEIDDEYGADGLIQRARDELLGSSLPADAAILLSLGGEGAALITTGHLLRAIPPQIPVLNPLGAGDAMLAGFLYGRSLGLEDEAALRQAVATGSAATLEMIAGAVDGTEIERMLPAIRIGYPGAKIVTDRAEATE